MQPGMLAGIIACVLGVLGILTIGWVFVPLAFIVALVGTIQAIKGKSGASIGVNILAWVLTVLGFVLSPTMWLPFLMLIGIGASAGTGGLQGL